MYCAVPEIEWEDPEVDIPEGGSRQVCFNSDIGTASAYNVMVAESQKGGRPADRGTLRIICDHDILIILVGIIVQVTTIAWTPA